MFKSRAVAKVNLSNFATLFWFLGIGNGFLTSCLFTPRKCLWSVHCYPFLVFWRRVMPMLMQAETPTLPDHNIYSILWLIVSLCTLGTGKGLPWYGLVLSFSSKETGLVFQSLSVPSKSSSNYVSNSSNLFWSWRLRWVQLALTTDWKVCLFIFGV
jgi:hypothetical protein